MGKVQKQNGLDDPCNLCSGADLSPPRTDCLRHLDWRTGETGQSQSGHSEGTLGPGVSSRFRVKSVGVHAMGKVQKQNRKRPDSSCCHRNEQKERGYNILRWDGGVTWSKKKLFGLCTIRSARRLKFPQGCVKP
jgi:hypothetical protein